MTLDTTQKPRIIRNYYEQYTSLPPPKKKTNDLEEIVQFLEHNTLQRLNDEKIEIRIDKLLIRRLNQLSKAPQKR